ncbi:MAG: MFS transporter [Solobacterium sp.]|nr:MFS transporter [Solobacterium sp.]
MKKEIWTKDYLYAILVLLCVHTGPYLLLSVITVYGKMLSGSDTLAGMMASVFALSGLFARILSAWLLDRMPLKKVLLIFMGAMAAASFLYIFTSTYIQAFLLRACQGLAYGVACTAMSTYIVQLLDPANRLEGIGYSSLTANLANAFGPAAAYALLGEQVDQFRVLFIAVFLSTAVSFALMLGIKENSTAEKTEKKQEEKAGLTAILLPFLIWALLSFSMSSVSAFLALSSLEKGFGSIGMYFTINVIGLVLSRFTMKPLIDRFSENAVILAMLVIIGASLAGIGVCTSVWQLYTISLPFGFANGCLAPILNTKMVNRLPDTQSGSANAAFFAAGDAGFIIGPTIWGMVSGMAGYIAVFLAAAVIALAAMLLQIRDHKGEK